MTTKVEREAGGQRAAAACQPPALSDVGCAGVSVRSSFEYFGCCARKKSNRRSHHSERLHTRRRAHERSRRARTIQASWPPCASPLPSLTSRVPLLVAGSSERVGLDIRLTVRTCTDGGSARKREDRPPDRSDAKGSARCEVDSCARVLGSVACCRLGVHSTVPLTVALCCSVGSSVEVYLARRSTSSTPGHSPVGWSIVSIVALARTSPCRSPPPSASPRLSTRRALVPQQLQAAEACWT